MFSHFCSNVRKLCARVDIIEVRFYALMANAWWVQSAGSTNNSEKNDRVVLERRDRYLKWRLCFFKVVSAISLTTSFQVRHGK